jgi:flagellar secretion chaperone FliS
MMYSANAARNRFAAGNLDGLSGPRIVVMCFDRLERDLTTAVTAIESLNHFEANQALAHAQDLLTELATMLDPAAWEHASSLLAIYDYLLRLLAVANMKKDATRVNEALRHIAELAEAFRAAERESFATARPPIADPAPDAVTPRRISVRA